MGLGLGDECILTHKAAKMFCWNSPPWIFCKGKHTTPLAESAALDHFEETQTWIHPRRWLDHPDNILSQTVLSLPAAWSTEVVKTELGGGRCMAMWATMRWQNLVRFNSRATLEDSAGGVVNKESILLSPRQSVISAAWWLGSTLLEMPGVNLHSWMKSVFC